MTPGPADGTSPAPGLPYDPTTDFPSTGLLPVVPPDLLPDKNPRSNAATAASAAGVRALSAQAIAFYFRAPVKAFFRTRVDYLAWARSVHLAQTQKQLHLRNSSADALTSSSRWQNGLRHTWDWMRGTTPGVLTTAIRHHGWGVVPNQILPPLLANVSVGAVLYTSYLQILGRLHEDSGKARRTVYPPPEPIHTFTAGLLAGALQSLVAAPLDAIQARYDHRDLLPADGKGGAPKSMWTFSAEKLREIGARGIFAGYGLSLVKDSFGSAVFFSTFEYIKAQSYYRFVTWYYGDLNEDIVNLLATKRPTRSRGDGDEIRPLIIRPHYSIEPIFLLLAGIGASFTQQAILHPLTHFQLEHWDHLEDIDQKAAQIRANAAARGAGEAAGARGSIFRVYYHAYQETWAQCEAAAAAQGRSVSGWLYRGFWWNTIRQVPSTSAGLIIFELVRRKYGLRSDEVRINKDGYDIQLN
ncbi:hypothetical protein ACHAQA_008761 [Verticillium albo-atrum]